jgi:hypothetical protein
MKLSEMPHFKRSLDAFEQRDPELYEELREKMSMASDEPVEMMGRKIGLAVEIPLVAENVAPTPQDFLFAETIVRASGRPVLTIRENRVTTEFLGPDSQVWAARIQQAQPILDRVIPAVGRVEVANNPDFLWVGTGWLVSEDIIVTNRHVAREFGRSNAGAFTFRTGVNGLPMTARIDFLEEAQRLASLEYALNSVLWIAPPGDADVAFLRVARRTNDRPLPAPIEFANRLEVDDFVATIGYPARDPRVPDQDLVLRIFGDVYDKKRLAPGQLIDVRADEVLHDCSTLGGNSGSALVNLATGEAVGLHFSGLFLQANFAVSGSKVRDLLRRVNRGELPGPTHIGGSPASSLPATQMAKGASANSLTIHINIPVEVSIRVGDIALSGNIPGLPHNGGASGDHLEDALQAARQTLANHPDVIEIRKGYRFKGGWITDERVIVVEIRQKLSMTELQNAGKSPIPPRIMGIGIDVRTAALPAQLESLGINLTALEARARPGRYREPQNLRLTRVRERMKAIFHVSPDSGFPNLKRFLSRVKHHLTATMYEWEPNHISDAIVTAISPPGRSLKMVTQKRTPAGGTESAINDLRGRLEESKFKHVWASVGSGKLITSAYHIKVASRDGEEVWLSSGNWKDSNQADIDPAGENSTSITPLRQHNREWHAIIENPTLARLFQDYIEFDFDEAERVPLEEGVSMALPDLFVPETVFEEALERRLAVTYFDPLVLDRELEIQPLLTPDRNGRGNRIFMAHAIEMMKKGQNKIFVENQSFNLRAEGDNNDEFEEFFGVLRDKQQAGVEVKVIFRDAREFGSDGLVQQQRLLERLKDFGLDTSLDSMRVQRRCHTKGIIVDSDEVLLGSQNLTNEGSLFNRDASLLVRDPQIADYFERIFLFDWETLTTRETDELVGGMRIALPGEETPVGFRRVSLAELVGNG